MIEKQLLSMEGSFQQCIEMTDERWDYFPFMRIYTASVLLCNNNITVPLFSWNLNSSLNSLELSMALLHSRPTGKLWVPDVQPTVGLSPQCGSGQLEPWRQSPWAGDDLSIYLSVYHTTIIM